MLSDTAEFTYKCTDVYNPAAEGGVRWDDADVGVQWPKVDVAVVLSDKDAALPGLHGQSYEFFERWYRA